MDPAVPERQVDLTVDKDDCDSDGTSKGFTSG